MAVLGLLLVLLTGALTAGVVLGNTETTSADAFGVTVSSLSLGGLFLAGALTALVFAVGLGLLFAGLGRARRRRQQRKQLVAESTTAGSLKAENERLAAQLEEERSSRQSADNPVTVRGAGTTVVSGEDSSGIGAERVEHHGGTADSGDESGERRGLFRG